VVAEIEGGGATVGPNLAYHEYREKLSPVISLCAETGVPVNQKPGKAVRNSSRRVGLPLTAEVWAGSSRP
jgi:hypothetical protein